MKNHKPKKAYKTSRKKGSRRKKGLSGPSTAGKALSLKNAAAETGKQAGGTLTGFLISAAVGTGLDKITMLQAKTTDGKMVAIAKKAIKPLVLVGLGGTLSVMSRKKGNKFVAAIGDGIIVGGGFSAVKAIAGTKLAIFNGLGTVDTERLQATANYYQENLEELKKVAEENAKRIELKGHENEEAMGEPVTIPGTQLENMNSSNIL